MADKVLLRDYQKNILERLEHINSAEQSSFANYLGVVIGGRNVLVSLSEIKETLPMTEVQSVPLVQSWFLGVSNVRGVLYAVNDLGQLLDGVCTTMSAGTRMVLLSDDVSTHVSFLVDRLMGLRNLANMRQRKDEMKDTVCWKPEIYEDAEEKLWYVLDCNRLVRSKEFSAPYAS